MVQIKDGFAGSRMVVMPDAIRKKMASDPLTSTLYVTDIGYFPNAMYHYRVRENGVSQYILIYCVDGSGWIRCNGTVHTLNKNHFFIIPSETPHAYGASETAPWSIYWIHFTGSISSVFGDGFSRPCPVPVSDSSRIADRITIFEELYFSLETAFTTERLRYASSVLCHLLGAFKYIDAYRQSAPNYQKLNSILESACHYLSENLERDISLEDLCSYIGYSESYCLSLFRKYTGKSPMQYLTSLRIQAACRLLEVTGLKINQICQKVGIKDQYYFSRVFTKEIGVPPSEYRKKER